VRLVNIKEGDAIASVTEITRDEEEEEAINTENTTLEEINE
jgi:hypothetical protein